VKFLDIFNKLLIKKLPFLAITNDTNSTMKPYESFSNAASTLLNSFNAVYCWIYSNCKID